MSGFKGVREILRDHYHKLVLAMTRTTLWVIPPAVDGAAAGIGCDIALAADIRLASEKAFFAEISCNIGLFRWRRNLYIVAPGGQRAGPGNGHDRHVLAEDAVQWD